MFTRKGQLTFSGILMLMDALIIFLSFTISYWIRFISGWILVPKGIPPYFYYFSASVAVGVLWVIIFWMVGLYESRQAMSSDEEIYRVAKGTVVGLVAIMAFSFFYREVVWSRLVLGMATIIGFVLLSIERTLAVKAYHALMKKYGLGLKRAGLVGNGETAQKILEQIEKHPEYGYRIDLLIGISGCCSASLQEGKPRINLVKIEELSALADQHSLDTLFIALPQQNQGQVSDIVNAVEHRPIELKFVPDLIGIISHDTSVSQLGNIPLINLRVVPISDWDLLIKRAFDLSSSGLFLVLLSPIMALLAGLVKLGSKGPVFYSQERVGYDGTTFKMYKFRSMRTDAEAASGPVWATESDPRRTRLGSFMRKYSLDELPQFYNVMKGDMSLVGPRPERPFFVAQFKQQIPRYASRHKVKSGVTGWAQINGLRGDTSILERTKYDIFYIEHWSLLLDMKILFKTVIQVLFPDNAY
jgi:exopolysaccharide biosynthesis polyprenyl glycosylphosphotransferase